MYTVVYKHVTAAGKILPSNFLFLSGDHNFVTPTTNVCFQMLGFFHQISQYQNKVSFK